MTMRHSLMAATVIAIGVAAALPAMAQTTETTETTI